MSTKHMTVSVLLGLRQRPCTTLVILNLLRGLCSPTADAFEACYSTKYAVIVMRGCALSFPERKPRNLEWLPPLGSQSRPSIPGHYATHAHVVSSHSDFTTHFYLT